MRDSSENPTARGTRSEELKRIARPLWSRQKNKKMSTEKKKCCKDCKKGRPGKNESCKAKLLVEQLRKQKQATREVTEV